MNSNDKVLRVFVNDAGEYGNPVGIVLDQSLKSNASQRQKLATESGFSEVIFVDNIKEGKVSIYNPQEEVKFAGHAIVGIAYYLSKVTGEKIEHIICRAGKVGVRQESGITWVTAKREYLPGWNLVELNRPDEVDDLTFGYRKRLEHTLIWSWLDKGNGIVRARTFAPDWGIPEDEANGSGAMKLALQIGRELEIHHGKGSVIFVKPLSGERVEAGGKVIVDI